MICQIPFYFFQHFAEATTQLLKEKEKLEQEYADLKMKLELEYDELAEKKRSFQQEFEMLSSRSDRMKEYVSWSYGPMFVIVTETNFYLLNLLLIVTETNFCLLNLLLNNVTRYTDSKRGQKLKESQEKLALSESYLKRCEDRKQEISKDLKKSKELLLSQDQLKRNIDDNLNYRKTKARVDELTREIEVLEEKVLSFGGMSAIEAELKRHLQEKERLLSEVTII